MAMSKNSPVGNVKTPMEGHPVAEFEFPQELNFPRHATPVAEFEFPPEFNFPRHATPEAST
jgi:hypothetical protein